MKTKSILIFLAIAILVVFIIFIRKNSETQYHKINLLSTKSSTELIIIDATDLLDQIPKDHTISDARSLVVERLSNTTSLSL